MVYCALHKLLVSSHRLLDLLWNGFILLFLINVCAASNAESSSALTQSGSWFVISLLC